MLTKFSLSISLLMLIVMKRKKVIQNIFVVNAVCNYSKKMINRRQKIRNKNDWILLIELIYNDDCTMLIFIFYKEIFLLFLFTVKKKIMFDWNRQKSVHFILKWTFYCLTQMHILSGNANRWTYKLQLWHSYRSMINTTWNVTRWCNLSKPKGCYHHYISMYLRTDEANVL